MTENSMKKERSRAYPVISLEEALDKITKINENLGVNGQFNRESIAVGMGYKSLNGASARRVAALAHYGFLDRAKDKYSLSDLAKQYLFPVGDNDKEQALHGAALSPALFLEIYNNFKGQVVPKQFVNRLIQEFGIQQKAAPEVDKIFRTTMETAGILRSNGVLNEDMANPARSVSKPGTETENTVSSVTPSDYLSVNLPSGLIVSYSQDLASTFAFGTFGEQLKSLDDAVAKHIDANNNVKNDAASNDDKEGEV